VSVISDTTNAVVASIPVGSSPQWMAYDGTKGEVFVANANSNTVSVISDTTNAVVTNILVGSYPTGVAYDGTKGEVFVANANSNTVSVISDTTNAVVTNILVGSNPFGVAYDGTKGEVFVANQASNTVTVISDATNAVVASISVGSYPTGVAYDGGKGEVFVTNYRSNTVTVISDATNAIVAIITVGSTPFGAAYDARDGDIYVSNAIQGTMSIISGGQTPPPLTYLVSFTETGLPTSTSWSVTLNGTTHTSMTSMITFSEANGTYAYTISAIPGYSTPSYAGSIEVRGSGVTQAFPWTQVTYAVTFSQSGLPPGTSWSVSVQGTPQPSTTATNVFNEPNGTYSYTVSAVTGYTVAPSSGTITVNGASVTQAIAFSAVPSGPAIFGLAPTVFFGAIAFVIAIAVAGVVLAIRRKKRAVP